MSQQIPLVLSPSVRMEQERWAIDLAVDEVQEVSAAGAIVGHLAWSAAFGWELVGSGRSFDLRAEAMQALWAESGAQGDSLSWRVLSDSERAAFLRADVERYS